MGQCCDDDKPVSAVCPLLPPRVPHGTTAGDTESRSEIHSTLLWNTVGWMCDTHLSTT